MKLDYWEQPFYTAFITLFMWPVDLNNVIGVYSLSYFHLLSNATGGLFSFFFSFILQNLPQLLKHFERSCK